MAISSDCIRYLEKLKIYISAIEKNAADYLLAFQAGPSGNYPYFSPLKNNELLFYIDKSLKEIQQVFKNLSVVTRRHDVHEYKAVCEACEAVILRVQEQYKRITEAYQNKALILNSKKISLAVKNNFQRLANPQKQLTALKDYIGGYANLNAPEPV